MHTDAELHVVLRARGGVDQTVTHQLITQGKRARVVSRGKADALSGVEVAAADLLQREQALAACTGASVVYHCTGVPYTHWAAALPAIMENTIAGGSAAGATLVCADNCYMYAPTSVR